MKNQVNQFNVQKNMVSIILTMKATIFDTLCTIKTNQEK